MANDQGIRVEFFHMSMHDRNGMAAYISEEIKRQFTDELSAEARRAARAENRLRSYSRGDAALKRRIMRGKLKKKVRRSA